ncbi:hypothetical protein CRG98_037572 [Punica granatum]|uniref:Uncharacterized protein n=1 Tax=Punica granatum TaxID=22663 RepID=A0A2I0IDP4_PUNGR|nr:hypothetical protein CRG98_037572 [Punica granatum]
MRSPPWTPSSKGQLRVSLQGQVRPTKSTTEAQGDRVGRGRESVKAGASRPTHDHTVTYTKEHMDPLP